MSASTTSGRVAAENELLARLGLPPSASPEDVDHLHLAVSQFLAAAPPSLTGWARAQAAALDEAYLQLTDPVGLEGSALRSPMRPPTVVPGGPATPPARRDPVPAVEAALAAANPVADAPVDSEDDTDTDDIDALFASVTPGAHRDLTSGGKADKAPRPAPAPASVGAGTASGSASRKHTRTAKQRAAAPLAAPARGSDPWKIVAILASAVLAVVVIGFGVVPFVFSLGGPANGGIGQGQPSAAPSASGPTVDMTRIAALMAQYQASPNDRATLQSLGDEYFKGNDWVNAATFYDKALAVDPKNVALLLARGATYYNAGDDANAEKTWKQVVDLKPTDKAQAQEVHYDLGFLYLNSATPDFAGVQSEWNQVVAIDATTQLAQIVKQHLDSLVKASMIPAASGTPAASGSATPSGSASPAGSGAAASPAANVVNETAKGLAFVNGTVSAPANTAFTIHYDNQDSGLPHDIMIRDASGKTVFKGDLVTGPATVDYAVPALAAGTYTFTCSIHPTTMNGTLVVGS